MNTELAENEQNKGSITKNQGFNPHARKKSRNGNEVISVKNDYKIWHHTRV